MAKATKAKQVRPSMGSNARLSAFDTLVNLVSGMGTDKDKLTHTFFGATLMTQQQLKAAYVGDWISRKAVDIPAFDAFREWRNWQAEQSDITRIEELEKKFKIQRKGMMALQRARLYGGGALIMGVDQGKAEEELIIERVGKDDLKFVHVVSRYELTAGPMITDILNPYYGEPEYYTRSGINTDSTQRIHPSRVVRLVGAENPDPLENNGWGDSILQISRDAIVACGTVASSIAQLVQEAKLDVIKMEDLSANLMNDEYTQQLVKRFGLANQMKSLFGLLIIDKEEEWERITQAFSGLNEILQMYLLITCGANDIPATRFLGQSPAGLSATGESDTRNYYDRIAAGQELDITPAFERLDRVLIRSALGDEPEGIFYTWQPLWQMTEKDEADIATKKATVMQADVNAGLISPEVLRRARLNQLIEDQTYPGLEQIEEEYGDDLDESEDNPPDPASEDPEGSPQGSPQSGSGIPTGDRYRRASKNSSAGFPDVPARPSMADRIRMAMAADASTPRSLYIRRDVLNGKEIVAWAKSQGFVTTLPAEKLHVTIIYSRKPVDWLKIGTDDFGSDSKGNLKINAGGPRVLEQFGEATVLAFSNSSLAYRNMRAREEGASWDFEDYTPHITISWQKPADLDLSKVQPYQGPILLGPEVFEEVKEDWKNSLTEDFNPYHEPAGVPVGGRFASTPAGAIPNFKGDAADPKAHQKFFEDALGRELSSEELSSLQFYTDDGYQANQDLRNGLARGERSKPRNNMIDDLDTLLYESAIPHKVSAYRAASPRTMDMLSNAKSGDLVWDEGFTSASSSEASVRDFIQKERGGTAGIIRIELPKGAKALPIAHLSTKPEENEILIARKSVYSIHIAPDGSRYLRLEKSL